MRTATAPRGRSSRRSKTFLAEYPALDLAISPATAPAIYDRLHVLLDDFEPSAIHEDAAGDRWRVFFRTPDQRDAAAAALARVDAVRVERIDVPDEDWARRSQENLRAIDAGGLIVAPPWDVPKGSTPVIIIEPSMGFGTGHHATTRLCLRLMQQLDLRGARVLDVGTGSGVLALASWKLGASDVVAIDNDPDALENARTNIAGNGAAAAIDIIRDDLGALRIQRADVVLANLTGAVLVRFADELRSLVTDAGYLILSGFAPDDLAIIRRAFGSFAVIAEQTESDWAALSLRAESGVRS
jgi:ribosomal protein L11 methyltransferase